MRRKKMNDAQLQFQLKKLRVTDDDIIVIKIPRDETTNQVRQNLLIYMRKAFPNNQLLMVGSKIDMTVLPKKTLNAMGWFKTKNVKANEAKENISVEDEITKIEVKNFVVEQSQIFAENLRKRLNEEPPGMNLDVRVETLIKKG